MTAELVEVTCRMDLDVDDRRLAIVESIVSRLDEVSRSFLDVEGETVKIIVE